MRRSETPRLLRLPSGRAVTGRSLRTPPAPTPEWGLLLSAHRPEVAWPSRWVRWRDFWVPAHERDASAAITEAWHRAAAQRVEVACDGGIGRTGCALAALVVLDAGLDADAAIGFVRERYHPRAVELPWQRAWLRRWAAVRGPDVGSRDD